MKLKHAVPGLVWIAVGGGIYAYAELTDTPLVVRGTSVPLPVVAIGIGVVMAVVGLIRNRKEL
jgi:hypothetical protein